VADKAEVVVEVALVVAVAPATVQQTRTFARECPNDQSNNEGGAYRDKEETMEGHSVEAVAEEAMTTTTGEPLPTTLVILLLRMMLGIHGAADSNQWGN
jgi:hypothetical protein